MDGDYEEEWDPVRIFFAASILLSIILTLALIIFSISVVSDQRNQKEVCLSQSDPTYFYLSAVSSKNLARCPVSSNPLECEVEISGDVEPCLQFMDREKEDSCLFAATKDLRYCRGEKALCQARSTGDPSPCLSLSPYERVHCEAYATLDAEAFHQNKEDECHDQSWANTIRARLPKMLQETALSFYSDHFGYLD